MGECRQICGLCMGGPRHSLDWANRERNRHFLRAITWQKCIFWVGATYRRYGFQAEAGWSVSDALHFRSQRSYGSQAAQQKLVGINLWICVTRKQLKLKKFYDIIAIILTQDAIEGRTTFIVHAINSSCPTKPATTTVATTSCPFIRSSWSL